MWCLHGLNDPTMSIFIMIIITRGSAAWLVVVYLYFLRVWWRLMLVSFVYHDRSTDYWLPKCIILPANLIVRLLTAVDRTRDYLVGRFAWWLPGIIVIWHYSCQDTRLMGLNIMFCFSHDDSADIIYPIVVRGEILITLPVYRLITLGFRAICTICFEL